MRKKIMLLAMAIGMAQLAPAQKIYALVFCNTLDEKIGASCEEDRQTFINEVDVVASYLGYEVEWTNMAGQDCSREKLLNSLSNLHCTDKDIVFFYYSGHGIHASRDTGLFPQMCLKYKAYEESKFVPVHKVDELISAKRPRLAVIMTDCCNDVQSWVSPKGVISADTGNTEFVADNAENYRKLFANQKGKIIVTSSKKGQTSGATDRGGVFSIVFWDEMYRMGKGELQPTWDSLLGEAKKKCLYYTNNRQEPYYETSLHTVATAPVTTPQPVNVISATSPDLATAMKQVLDPTKSKDERLSIMYSVLSTYFTSDATVAVMGRDLKTPVSMEVAEKFLRRLAIANRVRQVNIISEQTNEAGKRSYLVVHEVRNEKKP